MAGKKHKTGKLKYGSVSALMLATAAALFVPMLKADR